jgi:hypothetical protein
LQADTALDDAKEIFSNQKESEQKNHTRRASQLPAPVAHRIEKAFFEDIARPQAFFSGPPTNGRILLKSKKFVKCKLDTIQIFLGQGEGGSPKWGGVARNKTTECKNTLARRKTCDIFAPI